MSSIVRTLSDLILHNNPSISELPDAPEYGMISFKNGVPYIWTKINDVDQWIKGSRKFCLWNSCRAWIYWWWSSMVKIIKGWKGWCI